MRERSTWIPDQIAKRAAAVGKTADDPAVLNNPEHLKEQPSAEKYLTGGPSDFAEDVAAPNWKAEYSGGETKRNEIGMPEVRPDTFNHAEKTAGQQDEESDDLLEKKADVCLKLAKRMLKNASESMIEDQALAFMHMPDALLVETATRLAQQDDEGQGQGQQQDKQAQQQDQDDKGQQQDKQAQQQDGDKGQQQDKEAGQIPENFLKKDDDKKDEEKKEAGQIPENFKKKDDEGQDKSQQQDKEAALTKLAQQACQAFQQGNPMLAQQTIQQMVQQAQQQGQPMEQLSQQIQQMIQNAMGQPQQPMAQQQVPQDDQLLDQMLQVQATDSALPSATASASMDIQLEGPSMDVTEVKLGSDDEALTALFASHTEVREAAQAHALSTGAPAPVAGMTRTAAAKTVGTRPNGGVSQLGGGSSAPSGGGEIDKLSDLWASAPDVKNVFGG
jgi:hypothetical protein